jgi:hypothetical protein
MHIQKRFVAAVASLLLATASFAATIELHGVKIPDTATIAGTKLNLNGAGTRYKGPFKIYVADLYTSKPVKSLDELIAAPGPKRLTMTMLREIESGPFGKLLTRGVEDNVSKSEMSKLVPGLIRMGDIFANVKVQSPGDVIMMDWVPGTGMVITVKGKVQGEPFKEPEFFKAMMSIWLGTSPADFKLKEALLGNK